MTQSKLYTLGVTLRNCDKQVFLSWRSREKLDEACALIGALRDALNKPGNGAALDPDVLLGDDFGHSLRVDVREVALVLGMDQAGTAEMNALTAYYSIQSQLRRNKLCEDNPEMKRAMGMGRIAVPSGNA